MKTKIKADDDFIEVDSDFPDWKKDYAIVDDNKEDLDDTLELPVIGDKHE